MSSRKNNEIITKRLLILDPVQYGYSASTYYYTENISSYNITFLTVFSGKKRLKESNCRVRYLPKYNFRILNQINFLIQSILEIRRGYDAILTLWFPLCFLIRLGNNKNNILDIRTGFVRHSNKKINLFLNKFISFDSHFFNKVIVISKHLANMLGIDSKRLTISSVGSSKKVFKERTNKKVNLLYVGTLQNRNIHETVIGLKLALKKLDNGTDISYTIVGDSFNGNEKAEIKILVDQLGLSKIVRLVGYIPRDKIDVFFYNNNVGVSYVPVVDYYNNQSPTKTYEYLASGMPVIATKNSVNKLIITDSNGILIDSTPESFCDSIIYIYKNLKKYDFKRIYDSSVEYNWENIVKKNIQPLLQYGVKNV